MAKNPDKAAHASKREAETSASSTKKLKRDVYNRDYSHLSLDLQVVMAALKAISTWESAVQPDAHELIDILELVEPGLPRFVDCSTKTLWPTITHVVKRMTNPEVIKLKTWIAEKASLTTICFWFEGTREMNMEWAWHQKFTDAQCVALAPFIKPSKPRDGGLPVLQGLLDHYFPAKDAHWNFQRYQQLLTHFKTFNPTV